MLSGEVVQWLGSRGYGRIRRDDGAGDVFVHVRSLNARTLNMMNIGLRVLFDVENDHRAGGKPHAVNVAVEVTA